jgi:PBP1b-binding outer membrane lipoprotein LpoB
MKKILTISVLILDLFFLTGCNSASDPTEELNTDLNQSVDQIEVVHFHGTQQCWSCVTVGEYALKTIQEKFPEEYNNKKIVFKEINGELVINKEIVTKYQARGSSLFVNTIINGQDNIQENITVWRLVSNENQFIDYFEKELNKLLGK